MKAKKIKPPRKPRRVFEVDPTAEVLMAHYNRAINWELYRKMTEKQKIKYLKAVEKQVEGNKRWRSLDGSL